MLGLIKWIFSGLICLGLGIGCVTWLDLTPSEKQQVKRELLLAIDEGDSKPLIHTLKRTSGRSARRLLRNAVLWVLRDTDASTDAQNELPGQTAKDEGTHLQKKP